MSHAFRRPSRLGAALGALLLCAVASAALAAGTYGVSLFGELKYGPDFKNFEYVNPTAPKAGTMKFSAIGPYHTFNPFVVKRFSAAGIDGLFHTHSPAPPHLPSTQF